MSEKHHKMDAEELRKVWMAAANAKAKYERTEGQLYGAFCAFAMDNTLDAEAFMAQTKAIEEDLVRGANSNGIAAAIRSTSSSARSVISNALSKGLTAVRGGRTVGKTRLEQERKAVEKGHTAESVMAANAKDLERMMVVGPNDQQSPSSVQPAGGGGEAPKPKAKDTPTTAEQEEQVVMNLADNLRMFLSTCKPETIADLAHELLNLDERLTDNIIAQIKLGDVLASKKAA